MIRFIIIICINLLFIDNRVNAQTIAPDFTSDDCNTATHNLYSQLNVGKVVVIEWVMPCLACIGGATAAYNAVQSFAISHPGMVVNYMVDDLGNSSCSTLSNWATANGMDVTKMTIFKNSPITIDQGDYGGNGMPHVVVIAPNKSVLLNKFNEDTYDMAAITNAINEALSPSGIENQKKESVQIYPNPCTSFLTIKSEELIDQVVIKNLEGKIMISIENPSAKQINVRELASGNYIIQLFSKSTLISNGSFTKE